MNVAEKALARWDLDRAYLTLVATRENRVFRVDRGSEQYALRLHRPGYRSNTELQSELDWMEALEAGGIRVPRPVAARDGTLLQEVGGLQADLLTWLDGVPLGVTGRPLNVANPAELFRRIGRAVARLHLVSDGWEPRSGFHRCAWDRAGLVGEAPVWGRFWENPALARDDRALFATVRDVASRELAERDDELDYGLIHGDLVRENILIHSGRVQFIDLDDGGYGYRLFDVAGALVKNLSEPAFDELRDALIDGYRSERPLDTEALDLLLLLRACTYVGWIVPRMGEDGGTARNRRFLDAARPLAKAYLS